LIGAVFVFNSQRNFCLAVFDFFARFRYVTRTWTTITAHLDKRNMRSTKTAHTSNPPGNPRPKLRQGRTLLVAPNLGEEILGREPRLKLVKKTRKGAALAQTPRPATRVEARIDVGYGNGLFIRGQGNGLTWDKGVPLECVDSSSWVWTTDKAEGRIRFKLLLNDRIWSAGHDLSVEAGKRIEVFPAFG
jgi:hypothetical protein